MIYFSVDILQQILHFLEDLELIQIVPLVHPICHQVCRSLIQKCFLFACYQKDTKKMQDYIRNKTAYFAQERWLYEKILYHFIVKEND